MIRNALVVLAAAVLAPWGSGCVSKDAERAYGAGYSYGVRHDLGECYDESLLQLSGCSDAACYTRAFGFSRGCAVTAWRSDEFCAEVPDSVWDAAAWIKGLCASDPYPKACYKVIQQLAVKCL